MTKKYIKKEMHAPIQKHPLFNDMTNKYKKSYKYDRRTKFKKVTIGENAWKGDLSKDKIISDVKSILNKISPEKYDILLKKLFQIDLDNKEVIEKVINEIYKKAIFEPVYSHMYAKLCKDIYNHIRKRNFKYIFNLCHQEYKNKSEERKRENISNIIFIGELSKFNIISKNQINSLLKDLLTIDPLNIELLCNLLKIIGFKIKNPDLFEKLEIIKNNKNINIRYRFMIMDIFDLKNNGWNN
jgi:translation initiation factor 4G